MNALNSLEYRKAFSNYLRRGTPIHLSLKAEDLGHPTTHYIWRTRGDPQVRPSHMENNGKVFSWDNPPETGHPGEDYNCRCTAEPYERGDSEYAYQTITSAIKDNPERRSTRDFLRHFKNGGGKPLTLSGTGHLSGLIFQYFYPALVIDRINAQIIDAARRVKSGPVSYDFDGSYQFIDYVFAFGKGVITGQLAGTVKTENGMMYIEGEIVYQYSDIFTDTADLREIVTGSSALTPDSWQWAEFGGTAYAITDTWTTHFKAEAKLNAEDSMYNWP
jgi:hypothetical protein